THLELGYDPVDPLDVDVDSTAVIPPDSARERDIADLGGHLISKLFEAETLSRRARHRLAILLARVGTLDVDHSRSMPDTGIGRWRGQCSVGDAEIVGVGQSVLIFGVPAGE